MTNAPQYLPVTWNILSESTPNRILTNVSCIFFLCDKFLDIFPVGVNKFMDLNFEEFSSAYLSTPQGNSHNIVMMSLVM